MVGVQWHVRILPYATFVNLPSTIELSKLCIPEVLGTLKFDFCGYLDKL